MGPRRPGLNPLPLTLLGTVLRGVQQGTSWGSREAWLCLQLAVGPKQLI